MSLFQEHMKFANDVLRIRQAMIDEELDHRFRIFWDYRSNYTVRMFKIHGKTSVERQLIFGECSTMHYTLGDDQLGSVLTSKSIVYIHDDKPAWLTIESTPEESVEIVEYDEATHFQHSLVYSDNQLKALVVASVLRANPIMTKRNNTPSHFGMRFKIYWRYVPVLTKLLRYKDNGII